MSKETNYDGMSFRVVLIAEGSGRLLVNTEWIEDRDAMIYLTDSLNQVPTKNRKVRAIIETRGKGYVEVPPGAPGIQNFYP
jgi:hypothetical protein